MTTATGPARMVPVREVVDFYIGGGWGLDAPEGEANIEVAVVRGTDFDRVRRDLQPVVPKRFFTSSQIARRRLADGDIVLEISGGSKDQPVGRSLLVSPSALRRLEGPAICASFCKVIRADRQAVDPVYLSLWLDLFWRDGTLRQYQTQSTGLSNFHFEDFLDTQLLPLPTIEVQRQISDRMASLDGLISSCSEQVQLLDDLCRALYHRSFHRGVLKVASGTDESSVRLRELARDYRSAVVPGAVDASTPYVGLEHIPRRSIALSEWGAASEANSLKLRFERGDVLFGKIRPYFHKAAMAPVDGICSTDAIVIRPRDKALRAVVASVVSSDEFVALATQTSNGTKMPRANWDLLLDTEIMLPSADALSQFCTTVDAMHELLMALALTLRKLHTLRDLLLAPVLGSEHPGRSHQQGSPDH